MCLGPWSFINLKETRVSIYSLCYDLRTTYELIDIIKGILQSCIYVTKKHVQNTPSYLFENELLFHIRFSMCSLTIFKSKSIQCTYAYNYITIQVYSNSLKGKPLKLEPHAERNTRRGLIVNSSVASRTI